MRLHVLVLAAMVASCAAQETPKYPEYPSETPATLKPTETGFDYARREVMIPMRDGVKLHTVILVPKTATTAKKAPILMTRTPYSANILTANRASAHLGAALYGYDNAVDTIVGGGYIRVVQDIRGKYGSEGDYVMNRPVHGPLNPTPVDDSTDTYDTIDWLVKNIPECNGRVGTLGISYDGFEPLMAAYHPHPALKVTVPMNPMVDGWMGDDWFHNGAFRQQNLPYIYEQEGSRSNDYKWWSDAFDEYDFWMKAGSAGEMGKRHGAEQVGFWRNILAHPAYDEWWQQQAVDKLLAKEPLAVPMMVVHSLWDQEDIYGGIAVYKALSAQPANKGKLFLVMGPWHHGQEIEESSNMAAIRWGSATGTYFMRKVLLPFLDHYLKDNAPAMDVAPVTAFETGTNEWRKLKSWPVGCEGTCSIEKKDLFLGKGLAATWNTPANKTGEFEEYVSDPAKPVPFRARPNQPIGYTPPLTWVNWLVDDQREASGRPDVLSYVSQPLTEPLKISGQPLVKLLASTSGTDSDWVVKLIDVYPDEVADQPELGGYQLAVSMDIFRGRYRESFATAKPIEANKPLEYRWELPTANHVFLPGHRLMVQVQSSWFPLYDRNPQKFVPNIFWAKPEDYVRATQRIYAGSAVELPVVK
ncbi:CocE/NonD family hydrolase [Terriglobus sp. 2YAB30_2]|uniref:CocE/NonD family hydrolase n=3 Tax=unclassified Terriglobus TaxID=2628988 RepID=UPI003F98E357